mmetsp:Transcript_16327/g.35480  ORF Transcript_16327/g.35480 Transcript_16327/m.35480 type:complete len:396 (-) Transcript_16327:175-1362(-)
MHLGCHGGVVIIWALDLDFSFPVDVDPIQGHARGRHGHVPKFQETKASFVVDVDRQNRIRVVAVVSLLPLLLPLLLFVVVVCFVFDPREVDGGSKKVVEFLFVHVRRKVANVQATGVPCLLRHHGEIATRGNPGEIGGAGIGGHGDRGVLRQLLRCGGNIELGGTGLAFAAAFVGPVLFLVVGTKYDDSQLFSAAAANSVVAGAVVVVRVVAVAVTTAAAVRVVAVAAASVVSVSISSTTVSVHVSSIHVPTASSSPTIVPIVLWSTAAAITVAAIVVTPPVVVTIAIAIAMHISITALWWKLMRMRMRIVERWATATTSGATKGIAFEIVAVVVTIAVAVVIAVAVARRWRKTRCYTISPTTTTTTASIPELILILTRHPCRSIRYSSSSTAHG